MILELVGSRLLAPYFGNSLFVWTALIGIMLGFMSLGNFIGGRLADWYAQQCAAASAKNTDIRTRKKDKKKSADTADTKGSTRTRSTSDAVDTDDSSGTRLLFWILITTALSIATVTFIDALVLAPLAQTSSLRTGLVIGATILFAIPCTLLGMISPVSIRTVMQRIESSGSTVGSFYALSTLGSIVGTFLAGFWLISTVGSHRLVGLLAVIPFMLALIYRPRKNIRAWTLLVLTALAIAGSLATAVYASSGFDTGYDWYYIGESVGYGEGDDANRPYRFLSRDYHSMESAVYIDNGDPVVFRYYHYYDLALAYAAQGQNNWPGRTLLIGGGTFSYPRHQLAQFSFSTIDVVEIDPALEQIARRDFFLADDPRMTIHLEDGRMFLNRSSKTFDVIILDAFKSAQSIPYQLTTRESMQRCYDQLSDDGILAFNIIAHATGPGSRYVAAQYRTLKEVFPHVQMYYVHGGLGADLERAQNISIICTKEKEGDFGARLQALDPVLTGSPIDPAVLHNDVRSLTDDFAPVDQLLMDLH